LLKRLEGSDFKVAKYVRRADELLTIARMMRDPGFFGPIRKRRHRCADRIAEAFLHWAERQLEKP
jgi:hypothetical protein